MQPNQPHQPTGPGPQPPYRPPEYTINPNAAPQRHENGQYEVVPPPLPSSNDGHSGHNAYDFIMAPAAPKRAFSLGKGKGLFVRLGFIVAGVVVLAMAAIIIMSALAPKGSTPDLIAIAKRQQELIRVSGEAANQVTGEDTANFVTNLNLSITSSQQQIISYLAEHSTKIDPKTLALDQDSQTDTLLANAASANNYDPAVAQNLTEQLQTYETLLRSAYSHASTKETRQLVQSDFNGAELLLKQANALSSASDR